MELSDFIEPLLIEPLVEDFLCFIDLEPLFCMLFDDIEPSVFVVVC